MDTRRPNITARKENYDQLHTIVGTVSQKIGLAITKSDTHICTDAQPTLDAGEVERFNQVWAEVGRTILTRRRNKNGE